MCNFTYEYCLWKQPICLYLKINKFILKIKKSNVMNIIRILNICMYLYEWFCLSLGIGLILSVFKKINMFSFKKNKKKATYLSLSFGDPISFQISQFLFKVVFFQAYRNVSSYHWGN